MKDRTRSPYFPWLAAPCPRPPRDGATVPAAPCRKDAPCK